MSYRDGDYMTYAKFSPTGVDRAGLGLPDQQHWRVLDVGRNRDSGFRANSNFETALTCLGGESETVEVASFGHWGPGWFEIIIIDPSDEKAMKEADEIEAALVDYLVLDDEDYSRREEEEAEESWSCLSIRDRIKLCADNDVCYLQARHDHYPSDDSGAIREYLTSN